MKYEGISFNLGWLSSLTEQQFLAEANVNQHWFENDPNRDEKLKEVYKLACLKSGRQIESQNADIPDDHDQE